MRKSLIRALVVAAVPMMGALAGCEDGPTQTFQPAPANAGTYWNNGASRDGGTAVVADNTTTGFQIPTTGTTMVDLCPGDKKAMVWAQMVTQPIIPPSKCAGIDMSGGPTWAGLTVEQAEAINCQSDPQGDRFGNGDLVNSWGDSGEVWIEYLVSTRKILWATLWDGYVGTCSFTGPVAAGSHKYVIPISSVITKDGKNMVLDWVGNNGKNFIPTGDELYRALVATFAPAFPVDPPNVTCFDTGRCIKGSFSEIAYFYVPSLGIAIWIENQNANQPIPSVPNRIDIFPAKVPPYGFASVTLKMDQEGPRGDAGTLANAPGACVLKLGLTYSDFLADCVRVTGDMTKDDTAQNLILGGLSHGTENYSFDITGVDINFQDNSLSPTSIVLDSDTPQPTDTAASFNVDQGTLGQIANDYDPNGVLDLHGSGAVYKEYARLVRQNLLAYRNQPDGDVTKCLFPAGWKANQPAGDGGVPFDPDAFIANLPPWCTGFEGFITAAPPETMNDPVNIGSTAAVKLLPSFTLGMKMGHQKVVFCMDATGDLVNDYRACQLPYGNQGDVFPTSFAVALKIFGKGNVANMPTEVQDVRFFFRMYMTALIKYFTVANANPVPDLSMIPVSQDNLFFDSIGAGQFELAEYVDRRFASTSAPPTDFVFDADVRNGIMDDYTFSRELFRGEKAIYQAMLENQNDGLGQESNALLTNIFGSPVIAGAWLNQVKGTGKCSQATPCATPGQTCCTTGEPCTVDTCVYTAYYCGTHNDPSNCDMQLPPMDANGNMLLDDLGRPLLTGYEGAFLNQSTAFTLGPTPIKILQTYDDIQQAMIRVPTFADPYNVNGTLIPKSRGLQLLSVLVPWAPEQPGVGFPIAINGAQDKFIETAQLDLSGTTITANIDYDVILDPSTMAPNAAGNLEFLAVETTDFLGEVFLCQDMATKDLLTARMYSPVADILDWIRAHPMAVDACGLIIRYSPFNNYPDYITSLNGGVRLGVTQGGGFGRVVDATLFVPGQ